MPAPMREWNGPTFQSNCRTPTRLPSPRPACLGGWGGQGLQNFRAGEIPSRRAFVLPAAAGSWQIAPITAISSFPGKRMRAAGGIFGAFLCFGLGLLPAQAERRVALVIGNSAYRSVGELPNAR